VEFNKGEAMANVINLGVKYRQLVGIAKRLKRLSNGA
jgi:hypothetical protein